MLNTICAPLLPTLHHSLLAPPVRKRGLLEQLNLSADTFETQASILQGSPAARAPYLFVDTVLVGSADLAKELLMNDSGAYDVDFPPHMLDILGRNSMGTVLEPEHMQVRGGSWGPQQSQHSSCLSNSMICSAACPLLL
jgi:hypothetical protein